MNGSLLIYSPFQLSSSAQREETQLTEEADRLKTEQQQRDEEK